MAAHHAWSESSPWSSGSLPSGLFAVYTSNFSTYNKAWGSLAAVIIMLTWLWISALALLVGGEINAELRRRRAPPEM